MPLSTPVIFMVFRRPELTKRVFATIREAKPEVLLVVADGPRDDKEAVLCEQAREVTNHIDWDCQVFRNYSETNLGCRGRVSSGISWAFEHVEEAIILEDDCLPHSSFFRYCETLLSYYRDDERVMVVSGNNFQKGQTRTPYSYYFSKYNHCWGWATWRRAWQYWEFDRQSWINFCDNGLMKLVCEDSHEENYWTNVFNSFFLENKIDTWDYAWTFACWSQSGLTALPEVNLVSNIGFGEGATHVSYETPLANMAISDIGQIFHPSFLVRHRQADLYTFNHVFGGNMMRQDGRLNHLIGRFFQYAKSIGKRVGPFKHLKNYFR